MPAAHEVAEDTRRASALELTRYYENVFAHVYYYFVIGGDHYEIVVNQR